ncbi:hypothetical protein [Priestia megaterium]|uniref:hypothetical protein n=1 Tax=Priestia megaterium TaxID=1404 RepID=UPI000BA71FD9|nr:hypothetical protein [Priestia megaterium]PAK45954.1 hypothetical protein CHH47_24910 [Priestia megaterium]
MFASTLRDELARRQGQNLTINNFNYSGTGILALVQDDYVVLVESTGYALYETENIPVEQIQSVFIPA